MSTPLKPLVNVTMEGTNCIGVAIGAPPGLGTSGLHYSSDSGQNWYVSNITLGAVQANGTIRIQMDGPNAIANVGTKTYYSSDYGHTWTQSNLPEGTTVYSMSLFGQYALIGSGWGAFGPIPSSNIFYSSDYGATWLGSSTPLFPTPEPTEPRNIFSVTSIKINGTNAVAFTLNGIYYSTDGGASFLAKSTYLGNDITATSNAGVMTSNYVIASVSGIGFLYSIDYGQTFTLSNLTNNLASTTNSIKMDISGNCIAASLLPGQIYDIYYSNNYGASWTISTLGTYSGGPNASALSISNGIAVSIGIYSSDNGQTWTDSVPKFISVASISNVGLNVITSNSTNTYYSTNGGANYTIANFFLTTTVLSGFSIPTKTVGDSSFTITPPTTNSDGAFTYTSSNASVATISGTTITIVGAGTSTITATQAQTSIYTAETITASFLVNAPLTTTILSGFSIPTKTVGDSSFTITPPTTNSDGEFSYTSSNASVATINGTTITIVGAGTSTITATQAQTATYTAETITASFLVNASDPIICFLEGSKILYLNADNKEEYIEIEKLKKGDFIKTVKNDYKKIEDIGYSKMYNNVNDIRSTDKLYKCSKDVYPELIEDLVITGAHSILVSNFKDHEQLEKTQDVLGKIYITGMFYRLPACADERTTIYEIEGLHTIWHFSLENENYYSNYGVYANGLLVESCSKRMMKESGMHIQ